MSVLELEKRLPLRATFLTQAAASTDAAGVTTIEMRAVGYGTLNLAGRLFVPGAFAESIGQLKQNLEAKPVPIGWLHEIPIGKFSELQDQVDGPHLRGTLSKTSAGQDAAELVRDGLTAASVTFAVEDWIKDVQLGEPGETATFETPYGTFSYTFQDWVIYVVRAQLLECSLVLVGADDDSRVVAVQSLLEKAKKALPAITQGASWEDAAYSMALLMGGRGAAAFEELPDLEHMQLYQRLAAAYVQHGNTPPVYSRHPNYADVAFQHGEREIFGDRYLRRNLRTVTAGAQGIAGPLSDETREEADRAIQALTGLTRREQAAPAGDAASDVDALVAGLREASQPRVQGEQSVE